MKAYVHDNSLWVVAGNSWPLMNGVWKLPPPFARDGHCDTVAPGMSSDVVLPVDGFKGGTFRIYSGPAPKKTDAMVVAGLSQADGMAQSNFEITINGKNYTPASDLSDLSLFSGVARAVQHHCPPDSLRDGYNEIQIKQLPGEPQQKIVWVELRIVPNAVSSSTAIPR